MKGLNLTFFVVLSIFLGAISAIGQTSEFTFQGKLYESGSPVSTPRDMIFRLWDEVNATQIGSDVEVNSVQFYNGIFTVQLDFGLNSYNGSDRWVETLVSLPGMNDYTPLTPRQKLTSAPYSIRSLSSESAQAANTAVTASNSLQLGGVGANQYVLTTDARMSNARTPLPNSPSYVQNQFGGPQSSNFYISGTGRANSFITNNIGVNTTSPTRPMEVSGYVLTSGAEAGYLFSDRSTHSAQWLLYSSGFSARLLLGGEDKLAVSPTGILSVTNLAPGTSTNVCWNTSSGQFSYCSSSRRYKTDIVDYSHGIDLLKKLRPVSFKWKADDRGDIGFIAEEVANIEPLLTFNNKNDEIEGVNYGQISTILVNAVKQQQEQIDAQSKRIDQLTKQLCTAIPTTEACLIPEEDE